MLRKGLVSLLLLLCFSVSAQWGDPDVTEDNSFAPQNFTVNISSHLNPGSQSCNFYGYQNYFIFVNGEEKGAYRYSEEIIEIPVLLYDYVSLVSSMMPIPTPPVSYGYIHDVTGQYVEVKSPYDVVKGPVASEEILSIRVFDDVNLTIEYNISASCPSMPPTPTPTLVPELIKVKIITNVENARYSVTPNYERAEQGVYYFFKNETFTVTAENWTVGNYCGMSYTFGGFDGDYNSTQKSKSFIADKDMTIELLWHELIPSCPAYYLYLEGPGNNVYQSSKFKTEILYSTRQDFLGSYNFTVEFDSDLIAPDTSRGMNGVEAGSEGFLTTVSLYKDQLQITGFDLNGTGPGVDQQILIFHWQAGDSVGVATIGLKVSSFLDTFSRDLPLTTGAALRIVIDGSAMLGDVNNDRMVNIVDALLIAQYYVGSITEINEAAADVNRDNLVNIVDALLVAQVYVGLITDF
ncbi:MAG: dockerin type I repeat-containing protein [Spirochaetales bacterium]|nr:dockerin type I repeat-containing protein [Spirochaetales bacterium]